LLDQRYHLQWGLVVRKLTALLVISATRVGQPTCVASVPVARVITVLDASAIAVITTTIAATTDVDVIARPSATTISHPGSCWIQY